MPRRDRRRQGVKHRSVKSWMCLVVTQHSLCFVEGDGKYLFRFTWCTGGWLAPKVGRESADVPPGAGGEVVP